MFARRRSWISFFLLGVLACGSAWPLDVELSIGQFAHRSWARGDVVPSGVTSFAQTSDGRLWLGTANGLLWFDGLRFELITYFRDAPLPGSNVSTLLSDSGGRLWIGFSSGGASAVQDGRLIDFGERQHFPSGTVHSIVQDGDGDIWVAADGGLAHLIKNEWLPMGAEQGFPSGPALGAFVDRGGTLWVATPSEVYALPRGAQQFHLVRTQNNSRSARLFSQAPDGGVWMSAADGGLVRLDGVPGQRPNQRWLGERNLGAILFDRDGGLWLAGDVLRRLPIPTRLQDLSAKETSRMIEQFTRGDGLSGDMARSVFEDRDGNIWVATTGGLDRFSDRDIKTVKLPAGGGGSKTLIADDDGNVWVADSHRPALYRYRAGRFVAEQPAALFTAGVRGLKGDVWFGGPEGVARIDTDDWRLTPLPEEARGLAIIAMAQDSSGAMWVSIERIGLFRLQGGVWTRYGEQQGLPPAPPLSVVADRSGAVWFGYTDNRLARVSGDSVKVFTSDDGLAVGAVTALHANSSLEWVGGEVGLTQFDGTRFRSVVPASCQPFIAVSGLAVTARDELWVYRGAGLTRIAEPRRQLSASNVDRKLSCATFNRFDGASGGPQANASSSLAQSTDGRLWMASVGGLAWIDTTRIRRNSVAPSVLIKAIRAGDSYHQMLDAERQDLRFRKHTREVSIQYTSTDLTVPERVRFKYRLSGIDDDWRSLAQDSRVDTRYTNLGPGNYHFEILASRDGQIWSAVPAALDFVILPAFYQTTWFHALCGLLAIGLLVLLFRWQMGRARARLHSRMKERMRERERIARELHDTLLQGLQALIVRFYSVSLRMPASEPLREPMERALELADEVLIESRDRVKGLRDASGSSKDLSQDIEDAAKGMMATESDTKFSVTVHGVPCPLHLVTREDVFFIVREAMANAFKHAAARNVAVDLFYERTKLRITIRDDGRGLEANVIASGGQDGHWGLLGMRERASKVNATLSISNRPGTGVEVQLTVPAGSAYERDRATAGRFRFWRRRDRLAKLG